MKLNDGLLPYEKEFNQECTKISFFYMSIKEIKFQIEFLEKICGKELEIYEKESSNLPVLINTFNESIFSLNSEPSNLFVIITDLVTLIDTNFSVMRKGLIECYTNFENNIPTITKTLETFNNEIYEKSIKLLKEMSQQKYNNINDNDINNKEILDKELNQIFELVVTNIFKGLVYMHQLFFMYSKAKNDLNIRIKNISEEKSNNKVIDIVINDFSERKLAKESLGIHYEPLHFGNQNYDISLRNDSDNILSLIDSYLYYGQIFLKCIKLRKKLISQFKKLMKDILAQSPNNIIEKILHIRDKILKTKENFVILGFGTDKSWDLLISSWTYLYNTFNTFFQFYKEIGLNDFNSNGKKEEYKLFENDWSKLSKKIIELRNNYTKYYTPEKKREIKENPKEYKDLMEKEKQIKQFLNGECYDFLNSNVPIIREIEKQKANEIQEFCLRFKKSLKKNNEENIKNTRIELENSASIDIYQEVKDIFNKQNNKLKIKDIDNYLEQLKEKILPKLDFGQDNLTQNFKFSFDNYFKNNEESLANLSFSDSAIDSLKEYKLDNDANNNNKKDKDINNITINNNKINNNDISSFPSSLNLNNINSGYILKNKLSSKEVFINEQSNNNLSLNIKQKNSNSINIKKNENIINTSRLQNINESASLKDTNSENLQINNIHCNKQLQYLNQMEKEKDVNEILKKYYNESSIRNHILNRSKEVFTILNEIHFFERLAKASKDRMDLFEKEFQKGFYFKPKDEFDNIFINEKDIKSTSPLTLIFHYIFNPKTIIKEYPHGKSFFETIFTMRGDYNLDLIYDKYELDKIPKYFNDFDYVNNLFNNYNKNDLDLFLKGIDTWYKTFQFQLNFVHPIKKLILGPDKITIRDTANIYFISPTDLIVDYLSFGSDFPFSEKFVSSSQYRFHCDIKFNKNLGRFAFKTSLIVYNKVTVLSEFSLADILRKEANKNNQYELQINTWEPFRIVVESESKNNEIEANKIFLKNLKNTIFSYNDKKPDDYEIENEEDTSYSEYESNSDEKNAKNIIKKKKKSGSKDNLYYGIIFILGLLTIKSLFSINRFFSFDNLINILILISIIVVLYSSKQ